MRSLLLSVVLGVGAIGLFVATPAQARADGWHEHGYGYGRGYGGGYYNRGYYHRDFDDRRFYNRGYYGGYPYGGYGVRNFYYPRVYGGVYAPLGIGGYGLAPYPNYYYAPGFIR
jgi:hypothetical protein